MKKSKKNIFSGNSKAEQPKIGAELDFASQEAYNLLRANLAFSIPTKTTGKIIGITSSHPAEGKSFTAINIAYTLAKDGNKVLIIDSDMRRPSIYKTLDLTLTPGLSNLLTKNPGGVIREKVLHENLYVLTAGDLPPNPSELIGSSRMKDVLELVSKHYDYVILDLPPVLVVPDALVMSRYLDGIIVVVRHQEVKKREVLDVVRQLKFAKAHILGFVYNGYGHGTGYYKNKGKYYKRYYGDDAKGK